MERETAMKILKELHGKSLFAERTALETIIPELKESEDERVRKALARFHKSTIDIDGIKGADILAWLEKQGDTTSDIRYDGVNAGASLSVVNGNSFDYEKATITQKDFACDAEEASYTAEVATGDGSIKTVVSKKVPLPNPQSKEWSEEDDYNLQCMVAKVTYDIQKGNVGRNNELIDWLKSLKERVQPQPKQEWSEEDETMRKNIEGALDCYEGMAEGMVAEDWEEEKQWLKSLKDRVQPQSKIEWSEKDKEMAEDLIKGFQSPGKACHLAHTSKEIADWLKSLKDRVREKED